MKPNPLSALLPLVGASLLHAAPARAVTPVSAQSGPLSAASATAAAAPFASVPDSLWSAPAPADPGSEARGLLSLVRPCLPTPWAAASEEKPETHTTYRVIFTDVRPGDMTTPIQFSEFQLGGTLVPEPSTAILGLVGGMGLLHRRRR